MILAWACPFKILGVDTDLIAKPTHTYITYTIMISDIKRTIYVGLQS